MSIRKSLGYAAAIVLVVGVLVAWRGRHRLRTIASRALHASAAEAATNTPPPVPGLATPMTRVVAEPIFVHGRKPDWQDWGWAPHDDVAGGAARIDMSGWAGWQLVRPGLAGHFGGLSFHFKPPLDYGDFLTVHLEREGDKAFPAIPVDANRRKPVPEGWSEVAISMGELNPDDKVFDRVVFFVSKAVAKGWVSIDEVVLTTAPDAPPPGRKEIAMRVDGGAKPVPIHPGIYGTAFLLENEEWTIGMSGRRWGGNSLSRYNWTLANATNLGKDWFFENVSYGMQYPRFLKEDLDHGVSSVLTVPIGGWVAKDTTSVGFPVSVYGAMDAADPNRPEAGSGAKGGKDVTPGPPTRTSVEAPPAFVQRWVEAIRKADQARGSRSVHEYILDNEPSLWSTNHRDVHPEPLSYDELLRRTIDYGSAVRAADHDAVIAGPAAWGWLGYLYSAKDLAMGGANVRPDRRAHGDVPLLPWYLKKLKEQEQKTGTRILDVLDVHFYPQGKDVYSSLGGKALDALRIRSTRALWDPTYVDESWIGEPIKLIPRLKAWIAENSPGVGISIGEWNFGGETRMSGALATAEALGRFGQLEVTSAYYWVHPPAGSPAYWAFRAYRNFDGKGGRFQDFSLPTTTGAGTSLFASKDEHGTRYVFVALNTMPDAVAHTTIETPGCGHPTKREAYQFTGAVTGFAPPTTLPNDGAITLDLPPLSITVIDVHASP